jgi:hypothetical protein
MYRGTSAKYAFEDTCRRIRLVRTGSHAMQTKFRLQRAIEEGATSPEAGNQLNRSQILGDRAL